MSTDQGKLAVNALAVAVRGALFAMCAVTFPAYADDAADAEVNALVKPTNTVEVGGLDVSSRSSKFGEYNGLNKSGGYLLGNIDIRGGDAYKQGGTLRWDVYGTDMGTTSRSLGGSVGNQGVWNLGVGFDQLRHYTTGGSFQTPFQGSMGGNTFTLPQSFGVINANAAPGSRLLTPNQLSSFQTQDVYSERRNTSFTAGYIFSPQWNVKFDFNRLDQSGAKLIGASTDNFNPGAGNLRYTAEAIMILMNPTNYKTDTVNASLNWASEKAHLSASYHGSFFHDDFNAMTFSTPFVRNGTAPVTVVAPATGTVLAAAFPLNTMSTPPSNAFHQLNLSGGYLFSSATRLAGGFSYARNTQNDNYAGTFTPGTVTGMPVASLNGLVVSTHADMKVSHQATKALGLSAGFKYNERDNRTPAQTYSFVDLGGGAATATSIPMSNRRMQIELAGDYKISPRQRLHGGYEYDNIRRWCNDSLSNNARGAGAAAYYTTASCAQVPESKENKLNLVYRLKATDSVDFNAGYSHGDRKSTVNSAFYNPMQANAQGYENFGYLAFFQASRKENQFKAGVNWQAAERLNFGLTGRFSKDDYGSTLGVQKGETTSLNLDASYTFSETSSITAYTTWQDRNRDLLTANGRDALALRTTLWTNNLTDKDNTYGVSAKQKGLMGGKLEMLEDLTYSIAKSRYSTAQQFLPVAVGNVGDTPDIRSDTVKLRINGVYKVDKVSSVSLGYGYQRLKSNDYYYNVYQYGFTSQTMMPTNQQAPNYKVHVLFAAYRYTFQ